MNTCNFCSNPAVYAYKDFGAGTFLGLADGGKAYREDGSLIDPIKIVYGCGDHHQELYDTAMGAIKAATKATIDIIQQNTDNKKA